MGVYNYPDIFQVKTSKMFQGFKYIRVYLDGILVLTTDNWTNHLTRLEQVIKKLQEKGLKCNIKKSYFAQSEMEYLGV